MATTKGLKYIGNLNPHQQIHSFGCVNSELKQVTFLTTRTAWVTSEDWVKGCDWWKTSILLPVDVRVVKNVTCNCVHDVNMTHACMQVPHTPVLIQYITPLLRVKIPDRINRVPLCTYISHVGCNTGETDVMIDHICTNIHISILFSYLHYAGWNSAGWQIHRPGLYMGPTYISISILTWFSLVFTSAPFSNNNFTTSAQLFPAALWRAVPSHYKNI
jgi:hypothetical protein